MIKPFAGKMRAVRVMSDPLGILLNTFEQDGAKFGYVIVYGEDSPAVFDGTNWHSILEDGVNWETDYASLLADQMQKIKDSAELDPAYENIAQIMTLGVV
jgi:hypothetical protein